MRFRLGGWAVAAVLLATGCGVDGRPDDASGAAGDERSTELASPELVSARDTLPPAPSSGTALTILLTHTGDATDTGLDAAAGALAQRPDVRVVIAVPGDAAGDAETISGFPVTVVEAAGADVVAAAVDVAGVEPDLVVVGIEETFEVGGVEPVAAAAVAEGIPALVVQVEGGEDVDLAAATMQLLEVVDLGLDPLLEEPASVHRLTVPSCRAGSLRGRLEVRATRAATPLVASECTSEDRSPPADELAAVASGHAALARLP